jgi:hypothetical protein
VRRGCISLGKIRCDGCQRNIPYAERYLIVEEEDGVEVEGGQKSYYCVDCCLNKGYAKYREEKGELVLTFFPGESLLSQQAGGEPPDEASGQVDSDE